MAHFLFLAAVGEGMEGEFWEPCPVFHPRQALRGLPRGGRGESVRALSPPTSWLNLHPEFPGEAGHRHLTRWNGGPGDRGSKLACRVFAVTLWEGLPQAAPAC